MADMHDPRRHDLWPTAPMPVVEDQQRGVYRAANHRRRVAIAAGAGALALLIGAIWAFWPDDSSPRGGSPVAAAPSAATTAPTEEAPSAEPTPSETPAPSPSATTPAPPDPDETVDRLREAIGVLEDNDDLDSDDAAALEKRLDRIAGEIGRGDLKAATHKLQQFAKKLVELREDDDISAAGFQALATASTQLARSLPRAQAD